MNKSTPIQQIREARGKCRGATALSCGGNRYCVFFFGNVFAAHRVTAACLFSCYLFVVIIQHTFTALLF